MYTGRNLTPCIGSKQEHFWSQRTTTWRTHRNRTLRLRRYRQWNRETGNQIDGSLSSSLCLGSAVGIPSLLPFHTNGRPAASQTHTCNKRTNSWADRQRSETEQHAKPLDGEQRGHERVTKTLKEALTSGDCQERCSSGSLPRSSFLASLFHRSLVLLEQQRYPSTWRSATEKGFRRNRLVAKYKKTSGTVPGASAHKSKKDSLIKSQNCWNNFKAHPNTSKFSTLKYLTLAFRPFCISDDRQWPKCVGYC